MTRKTRVGCRKDAEGSFVQWRESLKGNEIYIYTTHNFNGQCGEARERKRVKDLQYWNRERRNGERERENGEGK